MSSTLTPDDFWTGFQTWTPIEGRTDNLRYTITADTDGYHYINLTRLQGGRQQCHPDDMNHPEVVNQLIANAVNDFDRTYPPVIA